MNMIGPAALSPGLQNFIKVLAVLLAGFCIGLIPMLILAPGMKRSRVDLRNLVLLGIVPFIILVLSPGPVNAFIAERIFSDNETIKELLFYLFSRQPLWAVWLGFAIGTSARISFRRRSHRHAAVNRAVPVEEAEKEQDEGN